MLKNFTRKKPKTTDYNALTETPEVKTTLEGIERMCTRYYFASQFCRGKDVLEVACGAGQGLGYLAKVARKVIGGDIDPNNLKFAKEHYKEKSNIEVYLFDACQLPFKDDSFDVVILYETIYYLPWPERFLKEARRVLRKGGVLLICTANKNRPGFVKSPFTFKYFSVPELFSLLKKHHFNQIELFGDCPVSGSIKERLISLVIRIAAFFHLVPNTLKGRETLKKMFRGKLLAFPSEIEDRMIDYHPPVPISCDFPNRRYKVLFAVARV